jgi:uncharacterized protein
MDYQKIIDKFYTEDNALRHILLSHSQSVAHLALQIAAFHKELSVDNQFLLEASMLHDIGIIRCDADGIQCFGTQPYIRHGVEGAAMLRAEGYPVHARVCERHTGAGLSLTEIISQNLPLPHQDFLPETVEEQIICYADKFYSKTRLERQKTIAQAEKSLAKFGNDGLERFKLWEKKFCLPENILQSK